MLHAKFQNHKSSGSEGQDFYFFFAIYSHGGHLGHVTVIIYINFHFLFLRVWLRLAKQFLRKKLFEYCGHLV